MVHRGLNFAVNCLVQARNLQNLFRFALVSPQVWEARVFEYYQEEGSQEPTEVRRGQESYDAPNLRRRFFEEADHFDERDYYDNIYLHKEVTIASRYVELL